jgi:hypothetical protein
MASGGGLAVRPTLHRERGGLTIRRGLTSRPTHFPHLAANVRQREFAAPSEIESGPELPPPHDSVRRKVEDTAGIAAIHAAIRIARIHVIKDVERLGAELSLNRFSDDEILDE